MNHFYGPWCAWTIVATAATISCHSHNAECPCTAATFTGRACMFQREKMMTLVLTVMITFGTQNTTKLSERLSGWQPMSVSHCQSEGKVPGCLMPCYMPLWAWQLPVQPREESKRRCESNYHVWGELPCQGSEWWWHWCKYALVSKASTGDTCTFGQRLWGILSEAFIVALR